MVLFQQIILSDGEWATPNYVIEIRVKGHKYLVSVKRNTCISSFEVVNCSLLHHNYVPLPETPENELSESECSLSVTKRHNDDRLSESEGEINAKK